MISKEQQFYDALRDLFVGAKVEGESGFVNLMRVKSRYFQEGVLPRLKADAEAALKPFPEFREELFDKLYSFFSRYFSESGSIYFRHTAFHQNVYEKVYTDDQDVVLFWKTHMLYYVKTDRLFKSLTVEVEGRKYFFDASQVEPKRANEKRELVYSYAGQNEDGAAALKVAYSEKGRRTDADAILKAAKEKKVQLTEDLLKQACRVFEKQSEVDFFINKDARSFLREQFRLWLYNYFFDSESQWDLKRVRELQTLQGLAFKIVDFIAQFEDELVRIWNKPKFVRNSHYVITLDKIADKDPALLAQVLAHPGLAHQIAEWRELGMIEDDFVASTVYETASEGEQLRPLYSFLPLDTRHVPDLELAIVGLFDNLDAELDGWLIKSENYQALNTVQGKHYNRVDCLYADPPYNGETSEIIYENNYRQSSWLSILDNRLQRALPFLSTGPHALCIAIDDYEADDLIGLLEQSLSDYSINVVAVNHHAQGGSKANISRTHEYAVFAVPKGLDILRIRRKGAGIEERQFARSGTAINNFRAGRPNSFYAFLVDPSLKRIAGIEPPPEGADYPREPTSEGYFRVYPINGDGEERVWRLSYASGLRSWQRGAIFCTDKLNIKQKVVRGQRTKPFSMWTDPKYNAGKYGSELLKDLFGVGSVFDYPKSVHTVEDCIDAISHDSDEGLVLDPFGGSGTTAHAVINLNRTDGTFRQYVVVEMADYFDTVILPRVKKVVFCSIWKNGKANGGEGSSHFLKYYQLEQYEDALRHAHYEDGDLLENPHDDPYNSYVFLRDRKMLEALEVDLEQGTVKVDLGKLYPDIDVAETLANLRGKWIKRLSADWVEFEDGERLDLHNLDYRLIKPLIWW